jgi:hypothetical protein
MMPFVGRRHNSWLWLPLDESDASYRLGLVKQIKGQVGQLGGSMPEYDAVLSDLTRVAFRSKNTLDNEKITGKVYRKIPPVPTKSTAF